MRPFSERIAAIQELSRWIVAERRRYRKPQGDTSLVCRRLVEWLDSSVKPARAASGRSPSPGMRLTLPVSHGGRTRDRPPDRWRTVLCWQERYLEVDMQRRGFF